MKTKYKYYITDKKVIAVSSYAGKSVRGIAKCSPNDEFDVEFGKKLATARCDFKVAELRYKRACKRNKEAEMFFKFYSDYLENMNQYRKDSFIRMMDSEDELNKVLHTEA